MLGTIAYIAVTAWSIFWAAQIGELLKILCALTIGIPVTIVYLVDDKPWNEFGFDEGQPLVTACGRSHWYHVFVCDPHGRFRNHDGRNITRSLLMGVTDEAL